MATCGGSQSRARGEPGPAGRSTFGLWSSNNRPLGGPELLVQVPEQVPHSIPKMNNTERTKVETLSEVHETRIFKVFNDDDDDVVSENVDVGDIHASDDDSVDNDADDVNVEAQVKGQKHLNVMITEDF